MDDEHGFAAGNDDGEVIAALPLPTVAPEILSSHPIVRLWGGGYSLPVTYWAWGHGGSFAWGLVGALLAPLHGTSTNEQLAFGFWLLLLIVYMVIVGVGVWRSAGFFRGSPGWAILARISVLAPVGMIVIRSLALAFGVDNR